MPFAAAITSCASLGLETLTPALSTVPAVSMAERMPHGVPEGVVDFVENRLVGEVPLPGDDVRPDGERLGLELSRRLLRHRTVVHSHMAEVHGVHALRLLADTWLQRAPGGRERRVQGHPTLDGRPSGGRFRMAATGPVRVFLLLKGARHGRVPRQALEGQNPVGRSARPLHRAGCVLVTGLPGLCSVCVHDAPFGTGQS
ncbi:hypothetical protein GCM10020000_69220 [Streptomyces olivoverticillatus]